MKINERETQRQRNKQREKKIGKLKESEVIID